MEYFIDFQAFRKPHQDFVIKEMAVLNPAKKVLEFYVFKPPFEWDLLPIKYKVENRWLEHHCIHRSWVSGEIEYGELFKIIQNLSQAKKIYVIGDEKFKWLNRYLKNLWKVESNHFCKTNEIKRINHISCKHDFKKIDHNCISCNINQIYISHVCTIYKSKGEINKNE